MINRRNIPFRRIKIIPDESDISLERYEKLLK